MRGTTAIIAAMIAAGLIILSCDPAIAQSGRLIIVDAETITFGKAAPMPIGYYEMCRRSPETCAPSEGWGVTKTATGAVVLDSRLAAEMKRVNSIVNRAIRPVSDRSAQKVADRWTAGATSGDCEDYAITKKRQLIGKGWPSSSLLIALAKTARGEQHAVLIVRTDRGDLVLDNLSAEARGWRPGLYKWQKVESPDKPWIWNAL